MNRPTSKHYKRHKRVKRSNPLFVWLFVLMIILIMVPIQAAEDSSPREETVQQTPLEEAPAEALNQ